MENKSSILSVIILVLILVVLGGLKQLESKIDLIEGRVADQGEKITTLYDFVDSEVNFDDQVQEELEEVSATKVSYDGRADIFSLGKAFPALEFRSIAGDTVELAKLKGKVVLIDFWATWCGPCVSEIPRLVSTYEKYHKEGFEVVGISLDRDLGRLESFVNSHNMEWPQYYDGKGWENVISSRFNVRKIPTTVLLDRDGIVRNIGIRGSSVEKAVREHLGHGGSYIETKIGKALSGSLEVISVDPPSPAVLESGERLTVKFRYDLGTAEEVRIWARPLTGGRRTSGCKSHPSPPYRKSESKTGVAEGWFYFDKPTKVDEIYIYMQEYDSRETVASVSEKVSAIWGERKVSQTFGALSDDKQHDSCVSGSPAMLGRNLSREEAIKLEERIKSEPDDLVSRTKLLGWYSRERFSSESAREARGEHILWIIENRPEAQIAGTPEADLNPVMDKEVYYKAKKLWLEQIDAQKSNAAVLGNAAKFLIIHDRKISAELFKKAQALEPKNPEWPARLGHLYSLGLSSKSAETKAEMASLALEQFEKSSTTTISDREKFYKLADLAKMAYEAGELIKAENYAKELLSQADQYKNDWNYGNAIHHGNLVLGRIALKSGDLEKAKQYLVKAGKTPGSPQLNSFGPNMTLAKELLVKDEREIVIEYFELCGDFWKRGQDDLKEWAGLVREGGTPDFGGNLSY